MKFIRLAAAAIAAIFVAVSGAAAQSGSSPMRLDTVVKAESPYLLSLASGEKVYLLGVHPFRDGVTPARTEAARALVASLAEGKRVLLELGSPARDRSGVLLAYVTLNDDGTDLNAEVLRRGLGMAGWALRHRRTAQFGKLEAAAREAGVGMWASLPGEAPVAAEVAPAPAAPAASAAPAAEFTTTDATRAGQAPAPRAAPGGGAPAEAPPAAGTKPRESRSNQARAKSILKP